MAKPEIKRQGLPSGLRAEGRKMKDNGLATIACALARLFGFIRS
jgi:hypothetical protein